MIKHMAIILGVFLCVGLSSTAFAGKNAQTDGVLTISSETDAGPGLTYTPSPSTDMACTTSSTAYVITSASLKTDKDNGMEYGILSRNEGYYQRKQETANKVTATGDSATALPAGGDDWLDKNGSTPAP